MVAAAFFAAWGWRERARAGRLLLVSYGLGLVLLAAWGIYWGIDGRFFPQFSELGWL
jgi:hypothetical protein